MLTDGASYERSTQSFFCDLKQRPTKEKILYNKYSTFFVFFDLLCLISHDSMLEHTVMSRICKMLEHTVMSRICK